MLYKRAMRASEEETWLLTIAEMPLNVSLYIQLNKQFEGIETKHFKEKPEGSEKKTVRVSIFPHWLCCPSTV